MLKKIFTVFTLSTLLFLGYLVLIYDNTDSHLKDKQRFEKISDSEHIVAHPRQLSFLGDELKSKFEAELESDIKAEQEIQPEIDSLLGAVQPSCINGKDSSTMTPKEQLLEFVSGPCAPVVLVPGIFATRLTVHIDCELLSASNPDIFSACGWSTCSSWEFWNSKPSTDYSLWIGSFVGPMTIVTSSGNLCFGNLMQLIYDPTQPNIKDRYTTPTGFTVNMYGEKGTAYASDGCGFDSTEDLLPLPYQTATSKGFKLIHQQFEALGYQTGLNFFVAAYDWRSTTLVNGVADRIKTTLKQTYELTGKKSIIVAHSMGNVGTLTALNTLSSEEKEKYVANYVAISSALQGAPKLVRTVMGGNPEYGYYGYGLDFNAQQLLMRNSSSTFDIFPQDGYQRFADAPWMVDWTQRSAMEEVYIESVKEGTALWNKAKESGDYPYTWFPTPLENCTVGFMGKPDFCGMFMYNWSDTTLIDVQGSKYSGSFEDLDDILDEFSTVDVTPYWQQMLEDSKSDNVHLLTNPEVPVTLIYVSHISTEKAYVYYDNPLDHAHDNKFVVPDIITYTPGDVTVPTASLLLPALKWSWEYDHRDEDGQNGNAKPVKTVEMCSVQNNRNTIYDVQDSTKPYEVNKNEYIGAVCSCMTGTYDKRVDGTDCEHSSILADYNLASFLTNIAHTNQIIDQQTVGAYNLTDDQISAVQKTCPAMNQGVSVYFQMLNIVDL